ncbi:hypothetical protein [Thermoplasma volcanium GSS1]|uniref:DUF131 domain-containing protein n=1 Tax=Thermoplasma volcanium (strain ATCC 51530 / DSM 4299 / JCM 9571 / NBRC 15438 / GSS1) TaxID=273116 RepID=Q97CM2_THEVO|nr:DUF131 domain-containing protein [Thermoplasma volcanium]BAB59221.1 hypothetical protein [Thermoplasma volcanium GSS1]
MNLFRLGYILIIIGVIALVGLAALGQAHFALFVIFPVIYGTGLSVIPFLIIFLGIVIMFFAPFTMGGRYEYKEPQDYVNKMEEEQEEKRKSSFGGLIMIGPIPIIFGNNKTIVYVSIAIAILILLVFILYYFGR